MLFSKLAEPDPVTLVKDGVMQRQNMKKLITMDELKNMLREQGIEDVNDIKTCCIESSGSLSVVPKEGK